MSKQQTLLTLKALISFGVLFVLLNGVDLAALFSKLQNIRYSYALFSLLTSIVAVVAISYRWHLILFRIFGLKISFSDSLAATFSGLFVGQVLPGAIGVDVIRGLVVWKNNLSKKKLIFSLVVDRVVALVALLMMIACTIPFFLSYFSGQLIANFLIFLCCLSLIGLTSYLFLKYKKPNFLIKLKKLIADNLGIIPQQPEDTKLLQTFLKKNHDRRSKLYQVIQGFSTSEFLSKIGSQKLGILRLLGYSNTKSQSRASTCDNHKQWDRDLRHVLGTSSKFHLHSLIKIIALSILAHFLITISAFFLAISIGVTLDIWLCILLMPIIIFVTAIPISINGWGVREAAMIYLWGSFGVSENDILLTSLCIGITSILSSLPGIWFWVNRRPKANL